MKQTNLKLGNETLEFDFISFIRFPLIVGVVFIHAWLFKVNGTNLFDYHYFHGTPIVSNSLYPWYTCFAHLFSQIIPRISVPLFFFISGFLFFKNMESFSMSLYKQKLRKRVRTLLVPYVFWNVLAVLIYMAKKEIAGADYELNITDWILAFWDFKGMYTPACLPLWFIRDLMVLTVLTPFIFKAIKMLRGYVLVILTACWLSLFWIHLFELNCISVYFFTLGAYASIKRVDFIEFAHKYASWGKWVFLSTAIGILYFMDRDWSVYLLNLNILAGLVCCMDGVSTLLKSKKCRVNHFLESSTFFVFAFHIILLDILSDWLGSISIPASDWLLTLIYVAIPSFTVAASVLLYYLLQKTVPGITRIITGGR